MRAVVRPFRIPVHLLALFLPTLLLTTAPARAQDAPATGRNLYWSEMAVEAELDAEGRLHVIERQSMVFDGAWNGGERTFDTRLGQELRLERITRIDPDTGGRTELVRGDLDAVNEYDWVEGALRWRSRLESDPPFRSEEIVYELEYTIWPVLEATDDGAYLLRHDFAFADRSGAIQLLTVNLSVDPAWNTPEEGPILGRAESLQPGRGYVITLPLEHSGPGVPEAVPAGAPGLIRSTVAITALLVPLAVLLLLRRHGRELDETAPFVGPGEVDDEWLQRHIFSYRAEIVGAAWDRSIGEAEVAALLARLVGEGKLASEVKGDGKDAVLHLRRLVPLGSFESHEQKLLEGLFFDGGDETDTRSIREHYESKGFDPAGTIRKDLNRKMKTLPGEGRRRRVLLPGAMIVAAGIAVALLFPDRPGRMPIAVAGLVVGLVVCVIAMASAASLARRVTHRALPTSGVIAAITVGALLLTLLAAGAFEREGGMVFYRPGTWLLVGLLIVLAGIANLAQAFSRATDTPERLAFRRRLASARRYFEEELERPEPRLADSWFPYLLAFGLGPHIDRWFKSFGGDDGRRTSHGMTAAAVAASSTGAGGGGWTGGGPQFGGGSWGGGGAGGSWSVAAAGLASGVSAPSSSGGGGGGGGSSGGGGGGGW